MNGFCERWRTFPDGYVERLACNKPLWGRRDDGRMLAARDGAKGEMLHVSPDERYYEQLEEKLTEYGYLCATEGTGWDALTDIERADSERRRNKPDRAVNVLRACRRSAKRVRELSHCAAFKYFVTLTLDGAKIDRYDTAEIIRKMSQWADNMVRRHGLVYVLVPERHKDGAVHFHGFFNDALPVVDSGTISRKGHKRPSKPRSRAERERWIAEGGHVVYNLPSWTLGFTTAIELYGEYNAAVAYTCKYLTKQVVTTNRKTGEVSVGEKVGGRWFYHGGAFLEYTDSYGFLSAEHYEAYMSDELPNGWTVGEFFVPDTDLRFIKLAYWTGRGELTHGNGCICTQR